MSELHSLYIRKEILQKLLDVLNKKTGKDANGVELTISTGNKPDQYGQTAKGWVSQTKEQRDAKKDRFFVGNGKTFWSDTQQAKPEKSEPKPKEEKGINSDDDDLPF